MKFRLQLAAWFGVSLAALIALLMVTAHRHLDEELRRDRWDRSHPAYPEWVIHGSYTNEEVHDILGELMQVWFWVGIPAMAGALGIGWLLARRSTRPIDTINRQLRMLDTHSLQQGLAVPENDGVLCDLVYHINGLLGRVGSAYQNLDAFSSKVAHEIRTPLTLLRMKIERAAADLPPELSEELQDELARLSRVVEASLLAAKADSGRVSLNPVRTDLTGMLEDLREGYTLLAGERKLKIQWFVPAGLVAVTDGALLRQILHNLLENAVRYARTTVRVRAGLAAEGATVAIANDFDPVGRPESGIGLGLRLVRGLSAAMGLRFSQRRHRARFACRVRIPHDARGSSRGRVK